MNIPRESWFQGMLEATLDQHGYSTEGIQKAAALLARRTQQLLEHQKKKCADAAVVAIKQNQNSISLMEEVIYAIRSTSSSQDQQINRTPDGPADQMASEVRSGQLGPHLGPEGGDQ